ncbi:hypothetical protein H257_06487 [Aphanomyces astaci]|uniref:Tc1-like transposase DDE domain-containing protein n=1 Tax=Aphanomyces astaci TaxID=112090 RepID=W4GKB4_APHAT|nr:hypothetical protein H257_06487 [Aphanomyces astaci]ETV80092.1 hypothetical protein H257_06487 [Aphanomyces astaci]|eukprot:XP_009830016.1 hypothetical protein H257_06487 [Aphanomyces astaci]
MARQRSHLRTTEHPSERTVPLCQRLCRDESKTAILGPVHPPGCAAIPLRAILVTSNLSKVEQDVSTTGHVCNTKRRVREKRWPPEVNSWVSEYAIAHPCFYIEEFEEALRLQFPSLNNISASTICRALMYDLGLTRKEKRAREADEFELRDYYRRLSPYYSYPDQLVFVDETSKDGRDSIRKYAWSKRNQKAIVDLPFSRGQRVSALASFTTAEFLSWEYRWYD